MSPGTILLLFKSLPRPPAAPAGRDQPGPVADEEVLVEGQPERAAELVVGHLAVPKVVQAREEPPDGGKV